MRMFGIYNLLCDHCNLLFTGFALPGTLPSHHRKKPSRDKGKPESPTPQQPT
jgi:hypothetical protein